MTDFISALASLLTSVALVMFALFLLRMVKPMDRLLSAIADAGPARNLTKAFLRLIQWH